MTKTDSKLDLLGYQRLSVIKTIMRPTQPSISVIAFGFIETLATYPKKNLYSNLTEPNKV